VVHWPISEAMAYNGLQLHAKVSSLPSPLVFESGDESSRSVNTMDEVRTVCDLWAYVDVRR
jgi:hypothetical protein